MVIFLRGQRALLILLALLVLGSFAALLWPRVLRPTVRPSPGGFGQKLAYAAEDIVDPSIVYDAAYVCIPYPNGDVSPTRGVCADVVVRAYRRLGIDLQVLVHQDMAKHFSAYPQLWHLHKPDPNIDHRRVYNLATYFHRHGQTLPCGTRAADYLPGDIVVWRVQNLGHIGIISSRCNEDGTRPLIVHNIGSGQVLQDMLFDYPIIGHYRYTPR